MAGIRDSALLKNHKPATVKITKKPLTSMDGNGSQKNRPTTKSPAALKPLRTVARNHVKVRDIHQKKNDESLEKFIYFVDTKQIL